VREEQIDMREFYALVLDDDIKNRAAQFFTAMMAAKAGISAAEASKPAPIADRTAQDAGTGFVMRMSGDAVEKTKPTGERATRKASGRVRDSLSGLGKRKGT
jgi:hypothetical protein